MPRKVLRYWGWRGSGSIFLAQAADVDISMERGVTDGVYFPHGVRQLVARQDAAAMRRQIFQQAEFTYGSEDIAALNLNGHGSNIDLQVAQPQDLGGNGRLA